MSLLFGAVFLLFQRMRTKPATSPVRRLRTQRNNNPFALIQANPSPWQGLEGKEPDGFLKFKTVVWGVRAGYINLVTTYLNQGRTSIRKIFPVYAPAAAGNNPDAYIQRVSKITGIDPDRELTGEDIYAIGLAIARVEGNGTLWVDAEDWDQGYTLAIPRLKTAFNSQDLANGLNKIKAAIQKATAVAGSVPL